LSPEVREVMNVLAPFRKLTKHIERREISLQDYIPIFDKIIDHLQKTSQRFKLQAESQNGSCAIYEGLLLGILRQDLLTAHPLPEYDSVTTYTALSINCENFPKELLR
jgi:hypothetical protein